MGGDERVRAREIDLLRYQVVELQSAELDDPGEDADLERSEDVLADAVTHREAGANALRALIDDGGGRDGLAVAAGLLSGRTPYAAIGDRLAALLAEVDDVAGEVRRLVEEIEEDPGLLAEVRARRQLLRDLGRKYGDDLAAVIAYLDDATRRLATLESFDQRAAELDGARVDAIAVERAAALAIGHARLACRAGARRSGRRAPPSSGAPPRRDRRHRR